jgi:hypothetical protein
MANEHRGLLRRRRGETEGCFAVSHGADVLSSHRSRGCPKSARAGGGARLGIIGRDDTDPDTDPPCFCFCGKKIRPLLQFGLV